MGLHLEKFLLAALAEEQSENTTFSSQAFKEKCEEGIVFWNQLDLADAFQAIGLSERQIERIRKSSNFDKTIIIQKLLDELSKATLEDGLTQVYNRRYFERSLSLELDRSRRDQRPCGLIIADIDHFKAFNDNYGHDTGDVVLKSVASRIKSMLRSTDTVSRIGGEEFAIIIPNTFRLDAGYLAERIRSGIEALQVEIEGKLLNVTISMGVAMSDPKVKITVDELYKNADQALYQAKNDGRNCVKFSASNTEQTSSAVTHDERSELIG